MKPVPCAYCGDMVDLPFECSYCRDPFCADHRLPEEHRCVKLRQIRSSRFGQRGVVRDAPRSRGVVGRLFGRRR
ncbi:MAG: nucleotide-binding protein [Thaumarchaeota archaeon]|nr:nucleotide-binding protein [Nitrososphaerota archaeon]RNJ71910.1 MAG: nucleotide-binding protein [Thaumarchaeota archaeon S14]RNJ73839.1 MAG: nucleotide-binding protein [Thaumarchaeota archaeon S13]MDD9813865.1 nucleotide-binding protein [Nitrososphaerota archaeon]MDD9825981.1 nucleotide-binding protein [Nitrososphaerota archaeon]